MLSVPHFDSPPLFCRLLDAAGGGRFRVGPAGAAAVRVEVVPFGGAEVRRGDGREVGCTARPDLDLQMYADVPLVGLSASHCLKPGMRMHLVRR